MPITDTRSLHQQLVNLFQIPIANASDKKRVITQKQELRQQNQRDQTSSQVQQAQRIAQIAIHSENKYSSVVSEVFDNLTPRIVSLKSQLKEYKEVCPKTYQALELLFADTDFMGETDKTNEFSSGVFNSLALVKFADQALGHLGKDFNSFEEFKKIVLGVRDLHRSLSSTPNPYSNMFFEEFVLKPMRPDSQSNLAAPDFFELTELPHKYSIKAKSSTLKTFEEVFRQAKSKSQPWSNERKAKPNATREESQQFQYDYNFHNVQNNIEQGLNLFGCPAQFATLKLKLNKKHHQSCTVNIPDALYMLAADTYSLYSFGKRIFG